LGEADYEDSESPVMSCTVAFTDEELYCGDNPAIIAGARAENRLAECLPFVRRKRSLSQWRAYLSGQKRLERSMRRRFGRWCDPY
jgi:hypothetical protein